MSMNLALALIAVAAALLLTIQHQPRLFPIIALVAGGLWLLLALRILHFSLGGVPIDVVLGATLAVAGAIVWARSSGRTVVSAATILVVIGALQVLNGLHIR